MTWDRAGENVAAWRRVETCQPRAQHALFRFMQLRTVVLHTRTKAHEVCAAEADFPAASQSERPATPAAAGFKTGVCFADTW